MKSLPAILLGVLILVVPASAESPAVSALWGANGEAWSPTSRLPDFSRAGYAAGERPIPDYPVRVSVKDFGAKGDGVADDTAAFQRALEAAEKEGAVLVPAGRYRITDVIEIRRSGVVLRGEGPGRSVLVPPEPLSRIHPLANVDAVKSAYSFNGGFVTFEGKDTGERLASVIAPAARGESTLAVDDASRVKPGDWVRLAMDDPGDLSLLLHLHGGLAEPGTDTVRMKRPVDWAARVRSVEPGRIVLDRPLRVDVRPEWSPQILAMAPTVAGSGIEEIGFEFPGVPKKPHLQEEGYNAIQMRGAVDCWVRNVTFTDADNGVIVHSSRFCTIEGVNARADKRTGMTGHHALWASGRSQDVLFTGFRIDTTYVHDLTVEGFANGNVFTNGSGISINCDHHRNAPYENLFTDLDVGDPRRLYESSGREDRGPHSGARTTFWGLRGSGAFPPLPPSGDWPLLNVVGFGDYEPQRNPDGAWVEPGVREPSNLWQSQTARQKAGINARR